MKELKFLPQFVPLIESGQKTMTRRLMSETDQFSLEAYLDFQRYGRTPRPTSPYGSIGTRFHVGDSECEITSIRVERVQEITCEEALLEGVPCAAWSADDWVDSDGYPVSLENQLAQAYEEFADLWESIYPGSWDRDDWVWVIEFKKVSG